MSLEYRINVTKKELLDFIATEQMLETGLPVYPFSIVNADMPYYNAALGLTDGEKGTLFIHGKTATSYGSSDPRQLIRTLERCGVKFKFVW